MATQSAIRHLIVILGDQLDPKHPALEQIDPERDLIWMAEATEESTHVTSHKQRIALFLAAMRHYHQWLEENGHPVEYTTLRTNTSLTGLLSDAIQSRQPEKILCVQPGEYRLHHALKATAKHHQTPIEYLPDPHFLCTAEDFNAHADKRKSLRMEYFYRDMRRRYDILMDGDKPIGGDWNYDSENRKSFGKKGPGNVPSPVDSRPDPTTREVLDLVEETFPDHPGSLENFRWPVTRRQALSHLRAFIDDRLPHFGDYQDALWTDQPFLYHSLISSSLNLKLLHPLEVIKAAETAYRDGHAPLAATEGFIRQILGWREYVRGIYWRFMPDYLEKNALEAKQPLPGFYWTGETDMHCLGQTIRQTLEHGYAHHIQRLMVTGLFAMLLGVRPKEIHAWYLAIYVDAVEWVELPNTLGMSQFADGGIMASKPYCASGKYIQRMSNYCQSCRYDPAQRSGEDACPFTTLYWDFLLRNARELDGNPRMTMQLRNLSRIKPDERDAITQRATELKET